MSAGIPLELLALEAVELAEAVRAPDLAAPDRYSSPAEELLARVMDEGAALLASLSKSAVTRLLADPHRSAYLAQHLFTDAEFERLVAETAAVQATATLLGRSLVADHGERVRKRQARRTREGARLSLDVPFERQDTKYSCGAACLQAVLAYHGRPADEGELAELLGTGPETGTYPEAIPRVARGLGLDVRSQQLASLADLRQSLEAGRPVITCVQMYGGGHWVVVSGVGADDVTFMDPLYGSRTVDAGEWMLHWWDTARGKRYDRLLLSVGLPVQESRLHQVLESAPLPALAPDAALDFFRSLVPLLGTDPLRVLPAFRRTAFTLAVATETELLGKVKQVILDKLATGDVWSGPRAVQQVLDAAEVSQAQPGYARTVFRTNAMDAYNQGLMDQLSQEQETFPVWKYTNPDDGRSRRDHALKNGRYYPTGVSFVQVRGTDPKDVCNCRCVPVPVDKWSWSELRKKGARIADGFPDAPAWDASLAQAV